MQSPCIAKMFSQTSPKLPHYELPEKVKLLGAVVTSNIGHNNLKVSIENSEKFLQRTGFFQVSNKYRNDIVWLFFFSSPKTQKVLYLMKF